jgi:hypothetical protein
LLAPSAMPAAAALVKATCRRASTSYGQPACTMSHCRTSSWQASAAADATLRCSGHVCGCACSHCSNGTLPAAAAALQNTQQAAQQDEPGGLGTMPQANL